MTDGLERDSKHGGVGKGTQRIEKNLLAWVREVYDCHDAAAVSIDAVLEERSFNGVETRFVLRQHGPSWRQATRKGQ